MRFTLTLLTLCGLLVSCAPRRVILQTPPASDLTHGSSPMHVLPSVEHAPDPLSVEGENVELEGVAETLGRTIAEAAAPWARTHTMQRPGGWEMHVELAEARAQASDDHLTVELAAAITLTGTRGQVYLAQTHGYCKQSELRSVPPERVVAVCMESMAHDVAGWLEGVSP